MLKVAQLVEFWLVTPEVAGSGPVLQPNYCRLAKLVRQMPLKHRIVRSSRASATTFLCEHGVTGNTPPCHGGDFPGSNPGARLSVCIPIWQRSRAEIPFSTGSSPVIPINFDSNLMNAPRDGMGIHMGLKIPREESIAYRFDAGRGDYRR